MSRLKLSFMASEDPPAVEALARMVESTDRKFDSMKKKIFLNYKPGLKLSVSYEVLSS